MRTRNNTFHARLWTVTSHTQSKITLLPLSTPLTFHHKLTLSFIFCCCNFHTFYTPVKPLLKSDWCVVWYEFNPDNWVCFPFWDHKFTPICYTHSNIIFEHLPIYLRIYDLFLNRVHWLTLQSVLCSIFLYEPTHAYLWSCSAIYISPFILHT